MGHGSQLPPARVTCSRTLLGAWQPWPMRPSPTWPWEVIGFEELLSELIARAPMLRPHLGSRLVSKMPAYGARCRALSCEERCERMIANPVKSTCTSTTPQLSERAGADASAYNRCTARLIPRSWLLERCGERGDYVVRGGRLLSVLSRWQNLQKPNSIGVLSGRRREGFPHHRASPRLD